MSSDPTDNVHQTCDEGMTCLSCWDDITQENYVEYRYILPNTSDKFSPWLKSGFCQMCVNHLQNTQWEKYVKELAGTTCKAEQRRLLTRGPPINLRDPTAMPCGDPPPKAIDEKAKTNGDSDNTNSSSSAYYCEVSELWFASDNLVHSAKLNGSLVGEVIYIVFKSYISESVLYYNQLILYVIGTNEILGRTKEVLH
jgi:hypothetical protein